MQVERRMDYHKESLVGINAAHKDGHVVRTAVFQLGDDLHSIFVVIGLEKQSHRGYFNPIPSTSIIQNKCAGNLTFMALLRLGTPLSSIV